MVVAVPHIDKYTSVYIAPIFNKGDICLWRKKYLCVVHSSGIFGADVYFINEDVKMVVDVGELSLSSNQVGDISDYTFVSPIPQPLNLNMTVTPQFPCKYDGCLFTSSTIQGIGKHYVNTHGDLSTRGQRKAKNGLNAEIDSQNSILINEYQNTKTDKNVLVYSEVNKMGGGSSISEDEIRVIVRDEIESRVDDILKLRLEIDNWRTKYEAALDVIQTIFKNYVFKLENIK